MAVSRLDYRLVSHFHLLSVKSLCHELNSNQYHLLHISYDYDYDHYVIMIIIIIIMILLTRGMERSAVSSFLTTMSHIFLYVPTMLVVIIIVMMMTLLTSHHFIIYHHSHSRLASTAGSYPLVWSYSAICLSTGSFLMYEKLRYFPVQKVISLLLIPLLHCIVFGKNEIIWRLLSFSMKYFLAASSWSTPSSFYPPPQSSAKRSGRDLLPGLPQINWRKKIFNSGQSSPSPRCRPAPPSLAVPPGGRPGAPRNCSRPPPGLYIFIVHLYWGTCISVFVFLYLPCCFSWKKGVVCWQSENLVGLVCLLEIVSGT